MIVNKHPSESNLEEVCSELVNPFNMFWYVSKMLYKEIKPHKKLKFVDYLETRLCKCLIGTKKLRFAVDYLETSLYFHKSSLVLFYLAIM